VIITVAIALLLAAELMAIGRGEGSWR